MTVDSAILTQEFPEVSGQKKLVDNLKSEVLESFEEKVSGKIISEHEINKPLLG